MSTYALIRNGRIHAVHRGRQRKKRAGFVRVPRDIEELIYTQPKQFTYAHGTFVRRPDAWLECAVTSILKGSKQRASFTLVAPRLGFHVRVRINDEVHEMKHGQEFFFDAKEAGSWRIEIEDDRVHDLRGGYTILCHEEELDDDTNDDTA